MVMVVQPPRTCLTPPWPAALCWSLTCQQPDRSWPGLSRAVPPAGPAPSARRGRSCLLGAVGARACPGWSYANAAPHPSARLVPLTILSRPRVPPALPWPPAPCCSLGKRYGDSVPPRWDKRGGRCGWGAWSTPVLWEGGTVDAPSLGQPLLGDALGAEPPKDAVQPPYAAASMRPSVSLGMGDKRDPQGAVAPWDGAAAGPGAFGGGVVSQPRVTPGWAVHWWGLVQSPPGQGR